MADSLYNAIFERKSIRRYTDELVSDHMQAEILDYAQEGALKLYPELPYAVEIVGADEVGKLAVSKAPHFLLFYAREGAGAYDHLLNAGFVLQQLDLWLHTRGLGRCWLGLAKPKQREKDGMQHCITLAFGHPAEPLSRTAADFKRKALEQISTGSDPRLEAARVAPSAVNSQTWFFDAHDGDIDVFMERTGAIKRRIYGSMNVIDNGIALCHLYLASQHFDLPFNFLVVPETQAPQKDGYNYMGTITSSTS